MKLDWLTPREHITESEVERGLRMLFWDGIFAQVMLVLTTGAFLIGFALSLKANNVVIGLLSGIGPLLQTVQLPSIYLVERHRVRKSITLLAYGISRLALLFIAVLPLFHAPTTVRLGIFLLLLAVHHGLAAVGNCAFGSWIRDLIPTEQVERFFAKRLTGATFAGAVLSFAGGIAVDKLKSSGLPQPESMAYGVLFVGAAVAGVLSVMSIALTPEPQMPKTNSASLKPLLMEPFKDINFRSLLIFLGVWNFAVNFAAPFFAVYLLDRLELNMTWILFLSVISQIANVLFFGVWGRLAEQFSNKSVMVFCVPLFFLTFLMWPFTTMPEPHRMTLPLLIIIHVIGGVAAAGIGLCAGNLVLKSAPYGKGAAYLAVNALVSGAAATIAPVLAGLAADSFNKFETRLTVTLFRLSDKVTEKIMEFPTLDLKGMDFLFVLAFIFGLYSQHRLLAVREEGEVTEKVLRDAIYGEARRVIRQVSTVAGVRQLITIPYTPLQVLARRIGPRE